MPNESAKLAAKVFADDIEQKPTRDGFGEGVLEAGKADERIVVLSADLAESTRAEWFEKEFPERFVEMGVAEQAMATVASGMAAVGKIPFITSYAAFNPGRNYEQIRTTIALNQANVKVCGMHAGVSVGPDGATHQMLEDIGMMRMLPNMIVLNPGDALEAKKATLAAARILGPVYLRFGRSPTPVFTTEATPFVIGKAQTLWDGAGEKKAPGPSTALQVAILSTGALSYEALKAARVLEGDGIRALVVHFATIKPLDVDAVVKAATRAGAVVTVEEHQGAGGFGSAVAEVLSEHAPTPLRRIAVADRFGESGEPTELLKAFKLDAQAIVAAAKSLVLA